MEQIKIMKEKVDALKKLKPWTSPDAALLCEGIDAAFWKSLNKQKFAEEFCDYGGTELMVSILIKFEEDGLFKVKGAWDTAFIVYNCLCNLSEASGVLSLDLGKKGMIKLCAVNIDKYKSKISLRDVESLVRISVSILCNLSTTPGNRHLFREEGVAEKMEPFLTKESDPFLRTICMICLAYIVEEGQEETWAEKGNDTTEYLVGILKDALRSPDKRYKGLCDREIAQALGRLAVHDSNKCKILEAGGLPLLCKMLKDKSTDTQEAAVNTIWNLSFSDDVRRQIKENEDCIGTLQKLSQSTAPNVADAATGALWVISKGSAKPRSLVVDSAAAVDTSKESQKEGHVMISYQWGSQCTVLKIRDALKAAGYKVWLDVDEMHGSTLQGMAEAVENAYLVLICLSERYKESPNCRTEAEYAFQLRKKIIPIMMEEYYRPDGWLGMIVGAKLYMDFSGKLNQEDEMVKLRREIERHTKESKVKDDSGIVNNKAKTGGKLSQNGAEEKILQWSDQQVKEWLSKNGLKEWRPSFLQFDGQFLISLYKLQKEAPEFFYKSIQDEKALEKLSEIFKFTQALNAIMEE